MIFWRFVSVSFTVALFSACASYTEETREIRRDFVLNSYQEALTKLDKSTLKNESKNRLLFRLEKAMILDRLGQRPQSRSLLIEADQIADELYTTSVSKTAATFVVNEGVADYAGEDYEKVAIHTILALSFLEEQKYNEARVEAKKINTKLQQITEGYEGAQVQYKEDAFARFLSGLIYESKGDWDDAIIDYKKALELYESRNFRTFYEGAVPKELIFSYYGVVKRRGRNNLISELEKKYPEYVAAYKKQTPGADVVVIHETGNIQVKEAKEFIFPFGRQIERISFPYIRQTTMDRLHYNSGLQLGNSFIQASNVVNFNAIAFQSLEDRRTRVIAKMIARLVIKGQLTQQAEKSFGPLGGLAVNIAAAFTETADTRSWSLMPQGFFINRVRVPVGNQSLQIKTSGRTTDLLDLKIEEGKVLIFRSKG